ncbi:AraC family transcriptional regulator [Phreatobacter stygius]|uniref:Helix-turn-helix domain-containing protein n=1 Tax=Phreatobacter stygius TaxID=1940610 RepID=A0A4D7B4H9_9HYPH|nr:AraC family transcriptional regulator [Phreatobacter stygius]QCI63092.1 helix-turn-helix domain-containing protein [Phreatobacter stygius]
MAPVLTWSTDSLPARDRFDVWREERGRRLSGVTIELPPERRAAFSGEIATRPLDRAVLAEMRASAYVVSRTPADIARVATDSLVISHQLAGPGWCETRNRRSYVEAGTMSVGYSEVPYAATPSTQSRFHCRVLQIPLSADARLARRSRGLLRTPLVAGHRYTMLLASAFQCLVDDAPGLAAGEAGQAVDDLAELALLAAGAPGAGAPESRGVLKGAYLRAARRVIRDGLHRPDLSADTVAAALGVSVRQVHVLFEPTGESLHRTVIAMRIAETCRLLAAAPDRPVAAIAFACGFDSLATFYRTFRTITGSAPNDYRRAISDGPPAQAGD